MSFENDLKSLFDDAIDVEDTIWYDEHQTLFDAIVEMYEEMYAHEN